MSTPYFFGRPMFLRLIVACCFVLLAPNLGCAQGEKQNPPPGAPAIIAGLSAKNYPRLNGSSSTFPLAQLLLAKVLGLEAQLHLQPVSKYARAQSRLALVFSPDSTPTLLGEHARLQRSNSHRGTHESYEALINGQADMILVAREPSPDELKLAAGKKMKIEARPFARDALIFLVNKANPIRGLKNAQLRAIYEGKTTNWKSVGGASEPIRAYTRDPNSGSEELMRSLLMKDRKMIDGGERVISSMAGLLDAVARNPRALGYSIFYYETMMNPREENKTLAVDGVLPSRQSIKNETYPHVSPVYIVTRNDVKPGAPAAILRDWLLSPDGQKLVEESGYVGLS